MPTRPPLAGGEEVITEPQWPQLQWRTIARTAITAPSTTIVRTGFTVPIDTTGPSTTTAPTGTTVPIGTIAPSITIVPTGITVLTTIAAPTTIDQFGTIGRAAITGPPA